MPKSLRIALVSVVAAVLSACSAPAYHHVGDSTAGIFFNVPREWTSMDPALVTKAQSGWNSSDAGSAIVNAITWQQVWIESAKTTTTEVFGNKPSDSPIVYASARTLYSEEKQGIAGDVLTALQDVVLPVSSATADDGLDVRENRTITINGHQGIRQKLSWDVNGVTQTFGVRLLLDSTQSKLFTVIARCSDTCWVSQGDTLNRILASITLKEPSVG